MENMTRGYIRLKLTLSYDGRAYSGWQKDGRSSLFIQSIIEMVLSEVFKENIAIRASGRTDAKVHAAGQCVDFKVHKDKVMLAVSEYVKADVKSIEEKFEKTDDGWLYSILRAAINDRLPDDILVTAAEAVSMEFHSRFSAVKKTYMYRIDTREKQNVFSNGYAYPAGKMPDIEKMRRAAAYLVGTHDFSAFSNVRPSDKRAEKNTGKCASEKVSDSGKDSFKRVKKADNIRTIYEIDIKESECRGSKEVRIYITGDGFLYNMVRIIAGTLLEAGLSKREPESIKKALSSGCRTDAGEKLWPDGLYLMKVYY